MHLITVGLPGPHGAFVSIPAIGTKLRRGFKYEDCEFRTGPIKTADLGFTLMHEHLIVAAAGITQTYPELLGEHLLDRLVQSLTEAKNAGITTVVDTTTQ